MDDRRPDLIRDPPQSWWETVKSIGPGLIISANIVGSGELIVTTKLGADVGFTLVWFIIFSCFIKVFVQVELGRYAIAEGISSLEALDRVPGPRLRVSWMVWLWLAMYLGVFFQMSGMLGAIAQIFTHRGNVIGESIAVVAAAALVAIPLVIGRYRFIERLSTLMVVLFTFCTLAAVIALQWTSHRIALADIGHGLSFGFPDDLAIAFAMFGVTGVGAGELIYYPIWCIEKGYARWVGPNDGTQEWTTRAQGWLRVMRVDAWLSMVIYTVATLAFYLLGAAVLNRGDIAVDNDSLIASLSEIYTSSLGPWALWVFLVGAAMVLFSTMFVSTASYAHLFADAGQLFGVFRFSSPEARTLVIRLACVGIPAVLVVIYLITGQPVSLVLIGAFAQALMLPFLGYAAVYFRSRGTPEALRPGTTWTVFLWWAFLTFVALGVWNVAAEIGKIT